MGGQSLAHGFTRRDTVHSVGGQFLFLNMTDWVFLDDDNNGFRGKYKDIIERIRFACATDEDVEDLNQRVVGSGDVQGEDCRDATFFVFRNKIISRLYLPFVRASCLRRQTPMFVVPCMDKLTGDAHFVPVLLRC